MFDNNFDKIIKEASQVYEISKIKYAESWKTMTLPELSKRLDKEWTEWEESVGNFDAYHELLDVINVALMVATKLRNKDNSKVKNRYKKP